MHGICQEYCKIKNNTLRYNRYYHLCAYSRFSPQKSSDWKKKILMNFNVASDHPKIYTYYTCDKIEYNVIHRIQLLRVI